MGGTRLRSILLYLVDGPDETAKLKKAESRSLKRRENLQLWN